jgi:hypothetical protein
MLVKQPELRKYIPDYKMIAYVSIGTINTTIRDVSVAEK